MLLAVGELVPVDIDKEVGVQIEPVYLVAPDPPVPSVPTRRAFLWAGIGTLAGLAGGTAIAAGGAVGAATSERWAKALELASPRTPTESLLAHQFFLLGVLHEMEGAGERSPLLWRAIDRLAAAVVRDPSVPDRRLRALAILDVLKRDHPSGLRIDGLQADLAEVAKQ
ncbi:MAG: hypothetical protein Fur0037_28170 [Planctomycetota bacterium]